MSVDQSSEGAIEISDAHGGTINVTAVRDRFTIWLSVEQPFSEAEGLANVHIDKADALALAEFLAAWARA